MKAYFWFFLKGLAMGAADVVPGVSGGTVALLLGIFERLLRAVKSFDLTAFKFLFKADFKGFIDYTDLKFLLSVVSGIALSIISLGKLFSYLYQNYELLTMSFFFGLIVASAILISRTIKTLNVIIYLLYALGLVIAAGTALLSPSMENPNIFYLYFCGMIAICAMILPGISGSFILLILGNYFMVLNSIWPPQFAILIPFALGALSGLAFFSRVLTWLLKRFESQTLALMSGFVLGSLAIIYPWKIKIYQKAEVAGKIKEKVVGYEYQFPEFNNEFFMAIGVAFLGFALVMAIEIIGSKNKSLES